MRFVTQLAFLTALNWGCATAPSVPPERADTGPVIDTMATAPSRVLRLTPGIATYHFRQSADIRPQDSRDTTRTTLLTEALFSVMVTALGDSTYEISISADSVAITPSGSLPNLPPGIQRFPVSLGTILRASLSPVTKRLDVLLPDSLCAYGQLLSSAREIALLSLPYAAPLTEHQSWRDSSRFSTCRAGAMVETLASHEVTYSPSQPGELLLRTAATVYGAGRMRTDSVTVTGTVIGTGKAFLEGANRLPTHLQTESQGTIRIQLADSTMAFHQQTVQEWHRRQSS